jgi:predicted RNA-binding Zn-ribbon protein involved in translation (DUF1610 family)
MSVSTLCRGCGRTIQVPPGYDKRKIRCSNCGVDWEVPVDARAASPPAKPQPAPADSAAPVPPKKKQGLNKRAVIACPNCGETVRMSVDKKKAVGQCPACGWKGRLGPAPEPAAEEPAPPKARPAAEPPPTASLPGAEEGYRVTGPTEIHCPHCRKRLEPDVKVCPGCDYNLETGEKPDKLFEPFQERWEAGLSFRRRMTWFLVCQGLTLPLGVTALFLTGSILDFLIGSATFAALLAFLLGTYSRVDLARQENGKIILTQTWRIGFFELRPTKFRRNDYEGILTGTTYEVRGTDWIIFGLGIASGLIPGILFWYFAMQKLSYYVALAKDHGFPSVYLYSGWSQKHSEDIAATLHEISGLPML